MGYGSAGGSGKDSRINSTVLEYDTAHTVPNPTNLEDGARYKYILKGTGPFSFGDKFKFPGGVAPVTSTDPGSIDILKCTSDGTNLYCRLVIKDAK